MYNAVPSGHRMPARQRMRRRRMVAQLVLGGGRPFRRGLARVLDRVDGEQRIDALLHFRGQALVGLRAIDEQRVAARARNLDAVENGCERGVAAATSGRCASASP